MPSVRGEITRTLLRLSRRLHSRPDLREVPAPRRSIPALREGTAFGKYKIVRRLGAGGMGHVYMATQEGLERLVALKFLSPDLLEHPEMLRRLLDEAKMASRLNHPNIVTIHEVGEHNGEHFIASEYIEGETLRSALNKKKVDVQGGVDIVCQILSGLKKAHASGVIHRDLKPGNIMIRSDGYVKVIDFGLAKRTRGAESSMTEGEPSLTRPGAVVGTVFYMSPEQACGERVDHRTDIWSLGIILFEIVSQRRPFQGDSDHRIIADICNKPLPPIPHVEELPSGLATVIERALEKSPGDRYGSASEMLDELSTVGLGNISRTVTRPAVLRSYSRKRFLVPVIATLTALVAVAVFLAYRTFSAGPEWFQIDKVRQLTFGGAALTSAVSPDGKYLAYVSGDPAGMQSVFLMQLNGGSEALKIPARNASYLGLSFAPDDELFAVAKTREDQIGRLYQVPVIGDGPLKPIITDIDGPVAFSPDGNRMAFVRNTPRMGKAHNQTQSEIYVVDRADPVMRKPLFSSMDFGVSRYLAWSPEGERLAAVLFGYSKTESGRVLLNVIDLKKGERRRELPPWQAVGNLTWSPDGQSILTTAATHQESAIQGQIRQIYLNDGKIRNVTHEVAGYQNLTATASRDQIAVMKVEPKATLWVSEKNDFSRGSTSWAEAERRPNLSWWGGDQLLLGSSRGGFPNLWQLDLNEQTRTPITHENLAEEESVAVPNSKSIVYVSRRSGQFKIWRYDAEENTYTQLTQGPNADWSPAVTPDGKWILYWSASSATPFIFRVSVSGGTAEQVTTFAAQRPQISPDGKKVLCWMQDSKTLQWGIGMFPLGNPDSTKIVPGVNMPASWAPDSENLSVAVGDRRGVMNIWEIDFNGVKKRQLTNFQDKSISKFAWSPAGDRIACIQNSAASDVVLLSQMLKR